MGWDDHTPRADVVDGEFFVEPPQTMTATAALWALLHASRLAPRPWLPLTVLCGGHGSGKTTLARRFARAAQRSVACDLLTDGPAERVWADPPLGPGHLKGLIRHFGACPALCRPAVWINERAIAAALRESETPHPTIMRTMVPRPDRNGGTMPSPDWHSPGNVSGHPTRRTSVVFVDDADRLLSVPAARRREALDKLVGYVPRVVRHAVAVVLIGSPALVEVVSEFGTTQVIRLEDLKDDEVFADVVAMVFGTRDAADVETLHRTTRGSMGALMHVAAMRGLTPPFGVSQGDLVTRALPAPHPTDPD